MNTPGSENSGARGVQVQSPKELLQSGQHTSKQLIMKWVVGSQDPALTPHEPKQSVQSYREIKLFVAAHCVLSSYFEIFKPGKYCSGLQTMFSKPTDTMPHGGWRVL